jgi:hypothetical protein
MSESTSGAQDVTAKLRDSRVQARESEPATREEWVVKFGPYTVTRADVVDTLKVAAAVGAALAVTVVALYPAVTSHGV